MAEFLEAVNLRPSDDEVRIICDVLRAYYGEYVYVFADRQLGVATGEGLARWLSILRIL